MQTKCLFHSFLWQSKCIFLICVKLTRFCGLRPKIPVKVCKLVFFVLVKRFSGLLQALKAFQCFRERLCTYKMSLLLVLKFSCPINLAYDYTKEPFSIFGGLFEFFTHKNKFCLFIQISA